MSPANIQLRLTLPDGEVSAERTYEVPRQWMGKAAHPARQADELDWVVSQLPETIAQLYRRAGLELPEDKLKTLLILLGPGVEHTPEVLTAVVENHHILRAIVYEVARELGVDVENQPIDSRTGVLSNATALPKLAESKMSTLRQISADYEALSTAALELPRLLPHGKREHFLGATHAEIFAELGEHLTGLNTEFDERGRILDAVKFEAGILTQDQRDSVADADLPQVVRRSMGGSPGSSAQGEALTTLLAHFGLPGTLADEQAAQSVIMAHETTLGELVNQARHAAALSTRRKLLADLAQSLELRIDEDQDEDDDVVSRIVDLFAQERSRADRAGHTARFGMLRAFGVTEAEQGEQDARAMALEFARQATADAENLDRLRREMGKLLVLFGLPEDTSVVEITRQVSESLRAEREAAAEQEDRARALATLTHDVAAMVGAGTGSEKQGLLDDLVGPADLRSLLEHVQWSVREVVRERNRLQGAVADDPEKMILRSFAYEMMIILGRSMLVTKEVEAGAVEPQRLANELATAKTDVRRVFASLAAMRADRDASRQIIRDVVAATGCDNLGDTEVPGMVRSLLADLRLTLMTLRYPVGAVVELTEGGIATVRGVSPRPGDDLPIELMFENGSRESVAEEHIRWVVPRPNGTARVGEPGTDPGAFLDGEGATAQAPFLPVDGLKDILAKAGPPPKLEETLDAVGERIEAWGERTTTWLDEVAERADKVIRDLVKRRGGGE